MATSTLSHRIGETLIASTNWLSTSMEREFEGEYGISFAKNNYPLCFGLVTAYVIFIFGMQRYMADKKPFDLRYPLALWNGLLSVFSFIGMMRTVPYLVGMIMTMPYEETICTDPHQTWGRSTASFWVIMFIYSKVPELIDTVFIVLRKKPLIFLHWYHHVTVLMFCWNACATCAATGLYFVAMNYTVHALMYGYYCLQALNVCPKSFPAYLITLSQIAQMFIGTFVCCSSWYYMFTGRSCYNDRSNLIAGALMYGSYLYLFCEFAVKRYIFKPKKSGKAKLAAGEAEVVATSEVKKLD